MHFQLLKANDLIRIGRNKDGGYVVSEAAMKRTAALLSFGINDDWSFELDFCGRTGVTCYGFDFSVDQKLFLNRGLQQLRFFVGDIVKRRTINVGRVKQALDHFSLHRGFGSFVRQHKFFSIGIDSTTHDRFKSLEDILKDHVAVQKDIFLKIDIEGYEFAVMGAVLRNARRFHTLAIEIHCIYDKEAEFDRMMESLQEQYYIYHIHANNYGRLTRNKDGFPEVIEISCIRKDLVPAPDFYPDLSHLPIPGIDFPNETNAVDYQW